MNIITVILLLSAALNLLIAIYALRYRNAEGTYAFCLFLLSSAIYSVGSSAIYTSTDSDFIIRCFKLEYLGMSFVPVFLLMFALQFTGNSKWLRGSALLWYFLFPIVTIIIFYTDDYHHLFYQKLSIETIGFFPHIKAVRSVWFWMFITYTFSCLFIANVLFLKRYFKASFLYRNQAMTMFLGTLLPSLGGLYFAFFSTKLPIDFAPLMLIITGLLFSWGMFFYRLLDLYPVSLESLFLHIKDAVILIDIEKRIVNFNLSSRNFFPGLNDSLIGKPIDSLAGIDTDMYTWVTNSETESSRTFETNDAGETRFFLGRKSNVLDRHNRNLGIFLIFSDITILKRKERELQELNETKNTFFSIVAHDLKNPFNGITGLCAMILDAHNNYPREKLRNYIGIIADASNRSSALLNNLYEWSQSQTGKLEFNPQLIKVNELAESNLSFVRALANQKGILLREEISATKHLFADKKMIDTVLRNLLTNAIKFTPAGGSIILKISEHPGGILFSVKDNGVGMSKALIVGLFRLDRHSSLAGTNGERGSGLGLILCKEFVDMHSGTIKVDSMPKLGTIISVSIPQHQDYAAI